MASNAVSIYAVANCGILRGQLWMNSPGSELSKELSIFTLMKFVFLFLFFSKLQWQNKYWFSIGHLELIPDTAFFLSSISSYSILSMHPYPYPIKPRSFFFIYIYSFSDFLIPDVVDIMPHQSGRNSVWTLFFWVRLTDLEKSRDL